MDALRFDTLTRRLGHGSRRQVLAASFASALGGMAAACNIDSATAACKGFNAKCGRGAKCCGTAGLRCVKVGKGKKKGKKGKKSGARRCRCTSGTCPQPTPCCVGGNCEELCDGECCSDCFVEILSNGVPNPFHIVCCAASGGTVCGPKSDDRCCYQNQECVNGECCCDGCEGSVVCGGKCCAVAACCNGECCKPGEVCATTPGGQGCVSVNRPCGGAGECFANEICHGGVCCSGNRVCDDGNDEFCCGADEYCEFPGVPMATCCPINTICNSTYRGQRVRR